jgi:branched-chain amino acid transport system substrate-binding protein
VLFFAKRPRSSAEETEEHMRISWQKAGRAALNSLLIAVPAALWAGSAFSQDAGEVNITALLGITGPIASIEGPTAEGLRMAVKEINDAGGLTVAGRKVRLKVSVEDTQGKPDQAVGLARKVVAEGSTKIVFGPIASSVAVPSIEATQPKVMQVTPATIAQQLVGKPGKELLFDTTNPQLGEKGISPTYAKWVVENIAKPHGIKKIAVLLPNDALGQLDMDFFPGAFRKMGIEITAQEMFDPKASDFSALITKLKAGKPDALFWGYLDESGKTIIRQSIELGLTTRFISAPGSSGGAVIDQASRIDVATWPTAVMSLYNPSPAMARFVSAYQAHIGRKITAGDQFALYLYDPAFMVAKAIEKAGTTTDPVKIAQALRGMKYSGVMNLAVDARGQFHSDWDIGRMDKGGKITWTTIKVE